MNNANDFNWPKGTWEEINSAVKTEAGKVRTAQKVFPTTVFQDDQTEVQNDVISFDPNTNEMFIKEGQTKPFVELYQEFPLTEAQVRKEAEKQTCKSLSRMAAKALALAEDVIIFQGKSGPLPAGVRGRSIDEAHDGLIGEAYPMDPTKRPSDQDMTKVCECIDVARSNKPKPGVLYGENVFTAVSDGISKLTFKGQAPNYALFLPTKVYADTFAPPGDQSLVTTAERIKPLVEGGFYGTGTLPENRGLLVALGGDPTTLYVGCEARTELVRQDATSHIFKVMLRIQFVARDPRALVLLWFFPNNTVFRLKGHEKAANVLLATSKDWAQELPLQRRNGDWVGSMDLPPGKYHYKFIVDGQWIPDPAGVAEADEKGNMNSVLNKV